MPNAKAAVGIAVSSIGLPIAPEEVKNLLNRGVRGKAAKQLIPAGTGIGLYLGRLSGRVLLLHKGPIELPSDLAAVVWIDISAGVKAAGEEIRRELGPLAPTAL